MSRTKRRRPPEFQPVSDQDLAWAGLGKLWALEVDPRCPYMNGRDRNQTSYVNSAFKGLKHRGWGERHTGIGRRRLKRLQQKHIRQYMKSVIKDWEE